MSESEVKKNNLITCQIVMKTLTFPYTVSAEVKKQNNEKKQKQLTEDVYRLINRVVELGGVICPDKYKLEYEEKLVDGYLTIKIPESMFCIVEKLSMVQSCKIISSIK